MDCCLRLAGNQDNVSEWSDMYEWTVVYGWPGIRIMYQNGVTCMSELLFTGIKPNYESLCTAKIIIKSNAKYNNTVFL